MELFSALPQSFALILPLDEVMWRFIGYMGSFGIFGALGFRFILLSSSFGSADSVAPLSSFPLVCHTAQKGAATVGLLGACLVIGSSAWAAAVRAQMAQIGLVESARRMGPQFLYKIVLAALLVAAFAIARRGPRHAWRGAAILGSALALKKIIDAKWVALLGPLHELGASLWLGTLCVLLIVGLPAIFLGAVPGGQRGPLVAELVARFSRLALFAAGLLGITGIVLSWTHLKYLAALWTTPYGYVLDVKLLIVSVVVALGAWNWKRITPRLKEGDAVNALQRSVKVELGFAAIVVLLSTILVMLPTPSLP